MKQNTYDLATDILKQRIGSAFGELRKQYGKSNPYRQEKIPDKQRIEDFYSIRPEDIDFAKQQFGDEVVDNYLNRMNALIGRQANGNTQSGITVP